MTSQSQSGPQSTGIPHSHSCKVEENGWTPARGWGRINEVCSPWGISSGLLVSPIEFVDSLSSRLGLGGGRARGETSGAGRPSSFGDSDLIARWRRARPCTSANPSRGLAGGAGGRVGQSVVLVAVSLGGSDVGGCVKSCGRVPGGAGPRGNVGGGRAPKSTVGRRCCGAVGGWASGRARAGRSKSTVGRRSGVSSRHGKCSPSLSASNRARPSLQITAPDASRRTRAGTVVI